MVEKYKTITLPIGFDVFVKVDSQSVSSSDRLIKFYKKIAKKKMSKVFRNSVQNSSTERTKLSVIKNCPAKLVVNFVDFLFYLSIQRLSILKSKIYYTLLTASQTFIHS